MTHPDHTDDLAQDLFARKIAAHLDAAQAQLPYVVTERLRAAREQALAQRKPAGTPLRAVAPASDTAQHIHIHANGALSLGGGAGHEPHTAPLWLRRVLTGLPLVALAVALTFISVDEDTRATAGIAQVDAELLTSALPPDAYTDPGFLQYLQDSTAPASTSQP